MGLIIFTYSLLSAICTALIFLNYTLEKQRIELLLIKSTLTEALSKIESIQEGLKTANNSLVFNGDLNINQLLLGILLLGVVVGSGLLLYTCFSDPQTITNQITSSNLNIQKLIASSSNNITDSNVDATQAILKQLESIQAHLSFLESSQGKISALSSADYGNIVAGFSKSITGVL